MALLASWFAQYRDDASTDARLSLIQALNRLPRCFNQVLEARQQCKVAAQRIFRAHDAHIVGRGFGEPIAHEGAMVMALLAQINAEGYSLGSFRSSMLSLLPDTRIAATRTPVIVLILSDEEPEQMRNAAELANARGAYTIIITDDEKYAEGVSDMVFKVPHNGALTALNAIVPLQVCLL